MVQLQRLAIAPTQIQASHIVLTSEQQHYLNRVLRLRLGDRFIAMDGQGHWWLSELEQPAQAQILESIQAQTELSATITLQIALPKGNGMDEVVRQVTELGVACIVPVISDRTLLKPSPQKLERWQRIAQEAAEQSERQIIPSILTPVPFAKMLQAADLPEQRYICVARGDAPLLWDLLLPDLQKMPPDRGRSTRRSATIAIATGPEGGWTPQEVEQAIAAGYQPVSLGRRILRAITAPVVALSWVVAVHESDPNVATMSKLKAGSKLETGPTSSDIQQL